MARKVTAILREIDQIEKSRVLSPDAKQALIRDCKKEIDEVMAQGKLELEQPPAAGAMAPRKG